MLAAQEAGFAACRPGASFDAPNQATQEVVANGLLKLGMPVCEMSWVLENNSQTRHSIEEIGGRVYKTYRMYERAA